MPSPVPSYGYDFFAYEPAVSFGATPTLAPGKALPIGRDLKLDPKTGDLLVSGGDLPLVYDLEAIEQEASITLQYFLGEYFLDVSVGIPYYQDILVKAPNLAAIKTIFRDALLGVTGIKAIVTLDLDFNRTTRVLTVSYTASTDLGELKATVEL
jgi:hypothetical protein